MFDGARNWATQGVINYFEIFSRRVAASSNKPSESYKPISPRKPINRHMTSFETLKAVTLKLLDYCQANGFTGYDPYDALNSRLFQALPLLDHRLPRLVLTQLLKQSPVNFRPLLLIPKNENPKAVALFLMSFLRLRDLGLLQTDDLIQLMSQKLIALRSPAHLVSSGGPCTVQRAAFPNPSNAVNPINSTKPINPYSCWGYSFPWQTRTILVPRAAPNLVCTTFVANALLSVYEKYADTRYLDMAKSAAAYIVNELYWTDGDGISSLCYPTPTSRSRTHNANLLGAALLCRVYKHTGEKRLLECAMSVARYSAGLQREDGSWEYGEHVTQRWIDNFHTGYNLCALNDIGQHADTTEFDPNVSRGFEFYRKNFFREDGAPKYFHNRVYPIDIHCAAQSIITLLAFKHLDESSFEVASSVFRWAMANMWNGEGYFYYQALPVIKNRISYMRWSQAWMLLALSTFLEESWKQQALKRYFNPARHKA